MGNVVQLNGDLMESWDLVAVIVRGNQGVEELGKMLDEGYEPFAITHWMEMPQAKILPGTPAAPSMAEKVWFRRKQLVKLVTEPQNA